MRQILAVAWIVFWIVLTPKNAHSVEMYKYKDENGHWAFSDKKPKNQKAESQRLLVTEAKEKAAVINQGTEERPKLVALNPLGGPVQMWVDFKKTQNMRLTQDIPSPLIIPPQSEQFLSALEKITIGKSWSYQWQVNIVLGKPVKRSQLNSSPLGLPFQGGPFIISQSFKGEASHNSGPQAFYSVDISMPKGTPIVAARKGVIMDIESDFSRSGWSAEYADEANFVRLVHADGSMTIYAHLDPDSISVSIGQKVRQGDLLGLSGTTGYSTGPHLHFSWQINKGRALTSVPFEFEGSGKPVTGDVLLAPVNKDKQ